MKTLYHGSSVAVPAPLTGVGRRELDSGPGFYVTNLREQAERWARRVCVIRATDTPLLSIYEFDESLLPPDVCRLRLEHYDQQWLDFIVSSRRGEEPWRNYDIIDTGRALDILYNSHTYVLLTNPDSGLQLQSDEYILNDLLRELCW